MFLAILDTVRMLYYAESFKKMTFVEARSSLVGCSQ